MLSASAQNGRGQRVHLGEGFFYLSLKEEHLYFLKTVKPIRVTRLNNEKMENELLCRTRISIASQFAKTYK